MLQILRRLRRLRSSFRRQIRLEPAVNRCYRAFAEGLEGRTLFSGYALAGGVLSYNGITEVTNVSSFALRGDGNAYYLQTNSNFGVNNYSAMTNTSIGLVFKYAVRSDGVGFFWLQSDHKLYFNLPSLLISAPGPDPILGMGLRSDGNIVFWDATTLDAEWNGPSATYGQLGTVPMLGFGVRPDGITYTWQSSDKILYFSTSNTQYSAVWTTAISDFGMRSDGEGAFWAAAPGSNLGYAYTNSGTSPYIFQIDSVQMKGFGVRSDGGLYCWRNSDGHLMLQTPTTYNEIAATSAFASDGSGVGYYVQSTTNIYRDTPSGDTQVHAGYDPVNPGGPLAANLTSYGAVGPFSTVSYEAGMSGNGNQAEFYEPLYGAPTVNTGSGPVITSATVKVFIIFWGSWSNTAETNFLNSTEPLLTSNYFLALHPYNSGITGALSYQASTTSHNTLGSTFTDAQLQSVVNNSISAQGWPVATSAATSPVYMVVTVTGVASSTFPGVNGYHSSLADNKTAYGWAANLTGVAADLDQNVSREIAGMISDPLIGKTPGITVTAPSGFDWLAGSNTTGDLGDFEPAYLPDVLYWNPSPGGTYTKAQAFWSASDGAYVVEFS